MIDKSAAVLTLSVAVFEGTPGPPLVEVTAVVVFGNTPEIEVVTGTVMMQVPPTPIEPPLKFKLVSPGFGENVGVPQFDVDAGSLADTLIFNGKESWNATPLRALVFPAGLTMVIVIRLDSPCRVAVGENDLEISGGASTLNVAWAELPIPPLLEFTLPVVFR